jgi:hypothetical protein
MYRQKFITGIVDTNEQLIGSVIDNGDKQTQSCKYFANIDLKKSKRPGGILGGPGKQIHDKAGSRNLMSDSL